MENSYLQPVIRNIFGESPGNSVFPEIPKTYLPSEITSQEEYDFTEETVEENEHVKPETSETPVENSHNPEKEETDMQHVDETNHSAISQRVKDIKNEETILNSEESRAQSEKRVLVGKEKEKSIPQTDNETVEKEKVTKKTGFQKAQKEVPGKKESEVQFTSSELLPGSSVSLQKHISRDAASTQLLDDGLSVSNKLSQSDDTLTFHSKKKVSNQKIPKGKVQISNTTKIENKSILKEKRPVTDKPDKQPSTIIPDKQKYTSVSIDLIPPKKNYMHFEAQQKPQTKLVIGKLTVEVIQQEKKKTPANSIRERIIVETPSKEYTPRKGSGLKVKYGLGQL